MVGDKGRTSSPLLRSWRIQHQKTYYKTAENTLSITRNHFTRHPKACHAAPVCYPAPENTLSNIRKRVTRHPKTCYQAPERRLAQNLCKSMQIFDEFVERQKVTLDIEASDIIDAVKAKILNKFRHHSDISLNLYFNIFVITAHTCLNETFWNQRPQRHAQRIPCADAAHTT